MEACGASIRCSRKHFQGGKTYGGCPRLPGCQSECQTLCDEVINGCKMSSSVVRVHPLNISRFCRIEDSAAHRRQPCSPAAPAYRAAQRGRVLSRSLVEVVEGVHGGLNRLDRRLLRRVPIVSQPHAALCAPNVGRHTYRMLLLICRGRRVSPWMDQ